MGLTFLGIEHLAVTNRHGFAPGFGPEASLRHGLEGTDDRDEMGVCIEPPDYVIVARDGDDYGFPACNWSKPNACSGFAKPVALFPAHITGELVTEAVRILLPVAVVVAGRGEMGGGVVHGVVRGSTFDH